MKTELELRHLRVFITVVEAGAHGRAARMLGISQSTVSETVSALERALGTLLFRKSPRGATLTPSGTALLPYARRILAMTSEAVTEVAIVSREVSATLVVAAVESLSAYVLPSRLAALRRRWPNVGIEVITGTCADIHDSVAAGRSDLGLVLSSGSGNGESLIARTRLAIFGTAAHPLPREHPSPDQLRRCDFYMCDAAGSYHQVLRHWFEAAGVPSPRFQSLGTIEGVKRGVLAQDSATYTALGALPIHAVDRELQNGQFVELELEPALPALVLHAVLAPDTPCSPVVHDLIESLRGPVLHA